MNPKEILALKYLGLFDCRREIICIHQRFPSCQPQSGYRTKRKADLVGFFVPKENIVTILNTIGSSHELNKVTIIEAAEDKHRILMNKNSKGFK